MEFLKQFRPNFSRRKFFRAGCITLGAVSIIKIFSPKRKEGRQTARFLGQDGKLVEVQQKHLTGKKIPATKNQIMNWIWKDKIAG